MTPLHYAAFHGNVKICQLLLEHNANTKAKDFFNLTPLQKAAPRNRSIMNHCLWGHNAEIKGRDKNKRSIELAQLLLKNNAKIEVRDENNRTPFHDAASSNNTEVAQLLLEHNSNIERRDKDNRTPLHDAAFHDNVRLFQLLPKHNVDTEIKDIEDR